MGMFVKKKRDVTDRIDIDFKKDMKRMSLIRVNKKLARDIPSERSLREMTNLLRKTEGYKVSLDELGRKPKKKT